MMSPLYIFISPEKTTYVKIHSVKPRDDHEIDIDLDNFPDTIIINGNEVIVPQAVKSLPPLINAEGEFDHSMFPIFHEEPLVVQAQHGKQNIYTINGDPLAHNAAIRGYTRRNIKSHMDEASSYVIEHGGEMTELVLESLFVLLIETPHYTYLHAISDGSDIRIRFFQKTQYHVYNPTQIIKTAFAYARALILSAASVGYDWSDISEKDVVEAMIYLIYRAQKMRDELHGG